MYQTNNSSQFFMTLFFLTALAIGYGMYIYMQPLRIEAECSELALKTSGLTKSFRYDPVTDYDLNKNECLENALASRK